MNKVLKDKIPFDEKKAFELNGTVDPIEYED